MTSTEQSIWYVILPIMLTGIFSAVSWVVRGKYEHTKQLRSQYAFMKTELKLKNMKDKLEEFYWPIYLRLVRHLNYVKRFHKLSEGEIQSDITPIEEHIKESQFLPFAITTIDEVELSSPSILHTTNNLNIQCNDDTNDKKDEDDKPVVMSMTDMSDEKDEEKQTVVIDMTNISDEISFGSNKSTLDLGVDELIDEVKEMNDDTTIHENNNYIEPVVEKMRTTMRQRSKSKVGDLFDSMKKKMNRLMHMKKSYNRQMLDNLLEVKEIFEKKTAISSPDQELGANLLQLDAYVAIYKSIFESGDYYNIPCKNIHGIDFPFDIVRILSKKLSKYQNSYDTIIEELDIFEDDNK